MLSDKNENQELLQHDFCRTSFVGQNCCSTPVISGDLSDKKGKGGMVTYFDEKHCREYGCIYYDPDVILCCKRNFKDPVDGMDACCEPPAVQDDGFHALLDKTFS